MDGLDGWDVSLTPPSTRAPLAVLKIAIDEKMQETESSTNRGDITSCNIIDTFKKSYQIPNGIDNGSLVVNASINLVNILEISEKKQQVDDLFQMYQHFYNLYCSTTLFFYYI